MAMFKSEYLIGAVLSFLIAALMIAFVSHILRDRESRQQELAWPTTQGKVDSAVIKVRLIDLDTSYVRTNVKFIYVVEDTEFPSEQSWKSECALDCRSIGRMLEEQYSSNSLVTVYYDPNNHEYGLVNLESSKNGDWLLVVLLLLLGAVIFLGVGLYSSNSYLGHLKQLRENRKQRERVVVEHDRERVVVDHVRERVVVDHVRERGIVTHTTQSNLNLLNDWGVAAHALESPPPWVWEDDDRAGWISVMSDSPFWLRIEPSNHRSLWVKDSSISLESPHIGVETPMGTDLWRPVILDEDEDEEGWYDDEMMVGIHPGLSRKLGMHLTSAPKIQKMFTNKYLSVENHLRVGCWIIHTYHPLTEANWGREMALLEVLKRFSTLSSNEGRSGDLPMKLP